MSPTESGPLSDIHGVVAGERSYTDEDYRVLHRAYCDVHARLAEALRRPTVPSEEEVVQAVREAAAESFAPDWLKTAVLQGKADEGIARYFILGAKAAHALHLRSQPAVPDEGWQDISTVPKDETEVLLTDGQHVDQDRWVKWPGGHESWFHFRYAEPTHWRPLPAPPSPRTGEPA